MATKGKAEEPQPEPRIVEGAAMMVGHGSGGEVNIDRAKQLEQRMHNARNKAIEAGLSGEQRSAAIDEAIRRFQDGLPEEE